MLCDRVIGHLDDPDVLPASGKRSTVLDLTWLQCHSRTYKKVLEDGRTIRLLLPPGTVLQHGDVVSDDGGEVIWINLLPCELLIVDTSNAPAIGPLMYEIGNLHAPLEMLPTGFATNPDGPVEAVLRKYKTPFRTEIRRFHPLQLPNGESFRLAPTFSISRPASTAK